MQMRTTPYGNIRRRRLPATGSTTSAGPLFSRNFLRLDVSEIKCDFVLANEIGIAAARPGDERKAPGDEATWDGGRHIGGIRQRTFELL